METARLSNGHGHGLGNINGHNAHGLGRPHHDVHSVPQVHQIHQVHQALSVNVNVNGHNSINGNGHINGRRNGNSQSKGRSNGIQSAVSDSSPQSSTTASSKSTANGSGSANASNGTTKKPPKEPANNATKTKTTPSKATGQRFQCPRCPKNFSRIENLTRHQANHEEVGKFACVVCRKRFTRSDLLNRHRRIHNPNPNAPSSSGSEGSKREKHVTQNEGHSSTSPTEPQPPPPQVVQQRQHPPPQPQSQHFDQELHNGGRSMPQGSLPQEVNGNNTLSNGHNHAHSHQTVIPNSHPDANIISNGHSNGVLTTTHPNDVYHTQHQQQNLYLDHTTAGYQNILSHDGLHDQTPALLQVPPDQGLTTLMDAALAPQEHFAFTFTPAANFDPGLWDGFMLFGNNTNSYMGPYDADISWTLQSFGTDNSPMYDMVSGAGDFPGDPYHYVPYQQIEVHPIDAADAEDEETNDWPDKAGKSDAQPIPRRAPRIVPLHLIPVSWQPILDEARGMGLTAETIRPFQNINDSLRASLLTALDGTHFGRNELSRPEIADAIFPTNQVLDFFLRLYIRFVHPRFPVVHLPTFDIYSAPPLLLLSMMFLGSGHSRMDRGRFARLFYDHLRVACVRLQEIDEKCFRNPDNILTYFLLCLAGTWSGHKLAYEFAEGARGTLITALRRSRLLDNRPSAKVDIERFQREGMTLTEATWTAWIETEKRKRLGLCIYVLDCQFPALFNNQPYISKAETTNCVFPCPEEYWTAPTADSWKMLVGPADAPPSTYYLHALNSCLLRKFVKPTPPVAKTNGDLGKLILLYALHTHIFEWRQSTSMLNPTGLMGTFGTSRLPVSEGLKERRKWLQDALDSWGDCYGTSANVSATLLHKLAYISLDVSLSDMHLVAGRSNNTNDGDFAEENLKHWANSEMANSTMNHVYSMLDICHSSVNSGTVPDSSFEVAVCLFTGGIICWAYAKLRKDAARDEYLQHMRNASAALTEMGCWRMCCMFGRILKSFEAQQRLA